MLSVVMDHRAQWRRAVEDRIGMPFSRYRALRRIADRSRTQRDLANSLGVDASATTAIVADLVERGYIRQVPHATDRRCRVVEITDDGATRLAEIQSIPDGVPEVMFALSATQQRDLAGLLDVLRTAQA
ncbi:MarR family transcriptional regulator [Leekyejoonella antrihumi]|uniref:MarR family transcriptional regulator n=2 Tax=Leekyejoonella antrihumi TaxID=1660198 RepID=A0A563E4B2_9MICO|nr:MarR family transcriptional regulator [Leekyejoonella antrihumi]